MINGKKKGRGTSANSILRDTFLREIKPYLPQDWQQSFSKEHPKYDTRTGAYQLNKIKSGAQIPTYPELTTLANIAGVSISEN